jgi:DNA-binding transcriptional ArsR family regulator
MSIFDGLITSKMRIRILMRLFLNPNQKTYIRELASEMGSSPSQVSEELKNLNATGLLHVEKKGRQIHYSANQNHPLYPELHSMVNKALGMDRILESILERLGNLEMVLLLDDYAQGKDTGIIDLVLVGNVDQENLIDIVNKTERYIKRKLRTLTLTQTEYSKMKSDLTKRPYLELWKRSV